MYSKSKIMFLFIPLVILATAFVFWPPKDTPPKEEHLSLSEDSVSFKDSPEYIPYLLQDGSTLEEMAKEISFRDMPKISLVQNDDQTPYTLNFDNRTYPIYTKTMYDIPFVSLEGMAKVLGYGYGATDNFTSMFIEKQGENEKILALFREDQRDSLVEIHEKDIFQKEFSLEGKPYQDDTLGFMVPLKNLLTILGLENITIVNSTVQASSPENSVLPILLESFIENDWLMAKNYFEDLDQQQTPEEINFILLGDMGLGTNYGKKNGFDDIFQQEGGAYFLQELKPYFDKSDLVIANLENVFTQRKAYQKGKIFTYKAHRIEYLDVLKEGGITHVNVVNNHMVDYLQEGFDDTLAYLDDYGITYFGANLSKTDNIELGNIEVDRYEVFEKGSLKIGLIGYLGFNSSYVSDEKLKEDINTLKTVEKVDYIIADMHWGGQNTHEVTWKQKEMGRKLIDFGVDLVHGNHPHVLQEVEIYQGKPIYYSLGNFLFIDYRSAKDPDGIMINVTLTKDGSGKITEHFTHTPILWSGHSSKNTYQPKVMTDEKMILRTLGKLNVPTKDPLSFMENEVLENDN